MEPEASADYQTYQIATRSPHLSKQHITSPRHPPSSDQDLLNTHHPELHVTPPTQLMPLKTHTIMKSLTSPTGNTLGSQRTDRPRCQMTMQQSLMRFYPPYQKTPTTPPNPTGISLRTSTATTTTQTTT